MWVRSGSECWVIWSEESGCGRVVPFVPGEAVLEPTCNTPPYAPKAMSDAITQVFALKLHQGSGSLGQIKLARRYFVALIHEFILDGVPTHTLGCTSCPEHA